MAYVTVRPRNQKRVGMSGGCGCGCSNRKATPGMGFVLREWVDYTNPTIQFLIVSTGVMCALSALPGVLRLMGKID